MSSGAHHPQLVREITAIDTVREEDVAPQVQSTVYGTVSSTGWVQPSLAPYTYVQSPKDGLYEFDFVAFPPQGEAAKVRTPIRATVVWPQGARGIRVYASTNAQESVLDPENISGAEPRVLPADE
jgi:hypothetical protein